MSMKLDSLLCHRRSGVTCLCDLRPCLAGHKKMLLHHSPYLPTVSAASPICSDFQTFCPDWLHFGHFLCFGGIAASQLSLRIFPIYF